MLKQFALTLFQCLNYWFSTFIFPFGKCSNPCRDKLIEVNPLVRGVH